MKYSELIDFEPIESVIQLREADSHDKARSLVETFVISTKMAEKLTDVVFPNLQFDEPYDNKGLLIVGNYGTGKSHLMSFISALAEHEDLTNACRNPAVAKAAKPIIGRFKVIRSEIGSTQMGLRDYICGELEDSLAKMGVTHSFPPAEKVRNNKDGLTEMMGKFHEKYPDQGLLLFVDELLDYLRSRNDQELILDLNFLREVGEVCSKLRFRFLAGLQEMLFENPRFAFVADQLRRVQARFEQVPIAQEDVAFVVSERLLTKNDKQKAWIREHLEKFTPLYDSMAERIDEFVALFPIHPAYIERFELISVAEKREILKTLSAEMKQLLDKDVPEGETGLVSYDSYWSDLRDNPSVRSLPDVSEVIDKSKVLENRIKQAFTRKAYTPMALRISHALSVHRLTTDDIHAKIGPTASEIRDDLCLYHEALPEKNSDFLRTTVESCLNEIVKTMSGQFITHNKENDQYYLDLEKNIDYDTEIEKRSESLSKSELDRYYFDALKRVMECVDRPEYVPGYRIWEHEVEWQSHKISRLGYLFFGAPNERSTAQPPRDFYLYFMQPFEPPKKNWKDDLQDEVFFLLKHPDEACDRALRLYAGAQAMAAQAGSATKKNYMDKADMHLKSLTKWLREHMLTAFDVVHQGSAKKMVEFLKGHKTGGMTVREMVNLVGTVALESTFDERYPEYPKFSVSLTTDNLGDAVADGIRALSGGLRTNLATAILDGLELVDGDKIRPHESRYAKSVVKKLEAKPQGQVLNRSELLEEKYQNVEVGIDYKLEPELLVLVLLSLVHSGTITLRLVGKEAIDASSLADAGKKPVEDFCKFRHVERPKDIPLDALVELFELVGLPEGLIKDPNTREAAIIQLNEKTSGVVKRAVVAKQHAQSGLPCWGHELIPLEKRDEYRQKLDDLQSFLEKLQAFNTPGKLKNFSASVDDVKSHGKSLELLGELEAAHALVAELNPLTSYLTTAGAVLPTGDPWIAKAQKLCDEWQPQLRDADKRRDPGFRQKLVQAIEKCRKEFQDHYLDLHKKSRLGVNEETKKNKLEKDERLERLRALAHISVLSSGSLTDMTGRLGNLKVCYKLGKENLENSPVCPTCQFRPSDEKGATSGAAALDAIDEEMDKLLDSWAETIVSNLGDPTVEESIKLLDPPQQKAVAKLVKDGGLPKKISTELVQGIESALSGLTPIKVNPNQLLHKLSDGSASCTVDQFRERFDDFVNDMIRGKEVNKVRIVIEEEE
jgi:hypothetical protein